MQVAILSYILRIFEMPFDEDFTEGEPLDHYRISIWLIIMTITTVGYGDVSPKTTMGKVVTVMTAIWGTVLISLIVMVFIKFFDPNHKEHKAIKHIKMSRSAAKSINTSLKYFIAKKKYYIKKIEWDPSIIKTSDFL